MFSLGVGVRAVVGVDQLRLLIYLINALIVMIIIIVCGQSNCSSVNHHRIGMVTGSVNTAAGPAPAASACCSRSAAVPLSEPVGRVQKSFSSEGFEKQCNRAEFKWVRGAPVCRWLLPPLPDTPFNSSHASPFSL